MPAKERPGFSRFEQDTCQGQGEFSQFAGGNALLWFPQDGRKSVLRIGQGCAGDVQRRLRPAEPPGIGLHLLQAVRLL